MRRLQVRWTAPACEDLFEIVEFIGTDRPQEERLLGREILTRSKTLGRKALRGRMVPELSEQGIREFREIMVSRYRVIYRLHAEAVIIIAVMDAGRDFGSLLLNRLLR